MTDVHFDTFLLVQTNEERLGILKDELATARIGCYAVATASEGAAALAADPAEFDGIITDTIRAGLYEEAAEHGIGIAFVGTDSERREEAAAKGITIFDPANIGMGRISVEIVAEVASSTGEYS